MPPAPKPPLVGKPIRLTIPCAGLDPGGTVKVKVFEPFGLGGDPLDSFDATVDDAGASAKAEWTFDYESLKDKLSGARLIFVVEGAGRTSASPPVDFFDVFEADVKDGAGNPAANRFVVLHADRGADVPAQTDTAGHVRAYVPPGQYHLSLAGPVPPDQIIVARPARGTDTPADPAAPAADPTAPPAAAPADPGSPADPAPADPTDLGAHPARTIPGSVFGFDSAFPGPGIVIHMDQLDAAARAHPDARLVVFGHADPKGSDSYNKGLTDRRAKAVLALLTDDLALFESAAQSDKWGVKEYKAMLRGLGCNPGAIDDGTDALLEQALTAFQREYNAGVYHDGERPRAQGDLEVNGQLDDPTKGAIRDAYVVGTPGSIPASRFAGPRFAGCGKFNLISTDDALDRRVLVALFGPDGPQDSDFPCREGNAAACKVDSQKPMRCSFYREVVAEQDRGDYPFFFDLRWLRNADGSAHLSALTTLPDKTPVTFTVYKCSGDPPNPAPESSKGGERPTPGEVLGTADGTVSCGVCTATWQPPEGYDPFDFESWLVVHDLSPHIDDAPSGSDGAPSGSIQSIDDLIAAPGMQPPVFAIDSGEHWAFSRPPGARLDRIRLEGGAARGMALRADGGAVFYETQDGRIRTDEPIDVLLLAAEQHRLEDDGGGGPDTGGAGTGGDGG